MYLDSSKVTIKGKTYQRFLLRESYREQGKVKHRTIANLSDASEKEIQAIQLALRHKEDLSQLVSVQDSLELRQGPSFGAIWLLERLAQRLHITEALGSGRQGKLALWQIMARVLDQGSRLSSVRLATHHAVCDILGLDSFDEDDLYANLDWMDQQQEGIEDRWFRASHEGQAPMVYLYDVTSSYLEGEKNELGAFGYNRDGKKGKKQIVVGLLCDEEGKPLSVSVFPGNTQDGKTFADQVGKAAKRFGAAAVTFVGDRGMIKGPQMEEISRQEFHYITALTKPQIEKLLTEKVLLLGLFDEIIAEVWTEEKRYILRRNPIRAAQVRRQRESKLEVLGRIGGKWNRYLEEHPRGKVETGVRQIQGQIEKLRVGGWVSVQAEGRKLHLRIDLEGRREEEKLDGCYALVTDLPPERADKQVIHDRYKDLTLVESAFRTSKTGHLQMRPIYLRQAKRTRGHALVVMMAYRMVQELQKLWRGIDATVQEGLDQLSSLHAMEVLIGGKPHHHQIPQAGPAVQSLLTSADVPLPTVWRMRGIRVSTKTKLPSRRTRANKSIT